MMEKTALLTAAFFISSFVIFSSFPRFTAAARNRIGWSRTIRMVIPQRTAITELLAASKCDILVFPLFPYSLRRGPISFGIGHSYTPFVSS